MRSARARTGSSQRPRRELTRADRQRAGLRREQAGERVEQLALAVARDAGDADDLAGAQRSDTSASRSTPSASRQHRPCACSNGSRAGGAARPLRLLLVAAAELHAPADHRLRQRIDAGVGGRAVEHHRAGAHHRHRVARAP